MNLKARVESLEKQAGQEAVEPPKTESVESFLGWLAEMRQKTTGKNHSDIVTPDSGGGYRFMNWLRGGVRP